MYILNVFNQGYIRGAYNISGGNSISSRNSSPPECIIKLILLNYCWSHLHIWFYPAARWIFEALDSRGLQPERLYMYHLLRSCYDLSRKIERRDDRYLARLIPGEEGTTPRSPAPVVTRPRSCCRVASWSRIFATVSKQKLKQSN